MTANGQAGMRIIHQARRPGNSDLERPPGSAVQELEILELPEME